MCLCAENACGMCFEYTRNFFCIDTNKICNATSADSQMTPPNSTEKPKHNYIESIDSEIALISAKFNAKYDYEEMLKQQQISERKSIKVSETNDCNKARNREILNEIAINLNILK